MLYNFRAFSFANPPQLYWLSSDSSCLLQIKHIRFMPFDGPLELVLTVDDGYSLLVRSSLGPSEKNITF